MPQVNPNIIRGDTTVVTEPSFSDQLLALMQAISQQQYQQRIAKTQEDYQNLQEQKFATDEAHWTQEQDPTFEDFFSKTWLPAYQQAHPQAQSAPKEQVSPWGQPIQAQTNPLAALMNIFGGGNYGS